MIIMIIFLVDNGARGSKKTKKDQKKQGIKKKQIRIKKKQKM